MREIISSSRLFTKKAKTCHTNAIATNPYGDQGVVFFRRVDIHPNERALRHHIGISDVQTRIRSSYTTSTCDITTREIAAHADPAERRREEVHCAHERCRSNIKDFQLVPD